MNILEVIPPHIFPAPPATVCWPLCFGTPKTALCPVPDVSWAIRTLIQRSNIPAEMDFDDDYRILNITATHLNLLRIKALTAPLCRVHDIYFHPNEYVIAHNISRSL